MLNVVNILTRKEEIFKRKTSGRVYSVEIIITISGGLKWLLEVSILVFSERW